MNYLSRIHLQKPKIPDPFFCSSDESTQICNALKCYSKIIWRLSKKRDFFLYTLLSYPNRIFSFNEIYALYMITIKNQNQFQKNVDLENVNKDSSNSFIESVDDKTIKSVKFRISKLEKLIGNNLQIPSADTIKKYQNELIILKKYLSFSHKNAESVKQINLLTVKKNLKKNVLKPFRNSLQKIKDRDFELYSCLINHLKFDNYLLFFIGGMDENL